MTRFFQNTHKVKDKDQKSYIKKNVWTSFFQNMMTFILFSETINLHNNFSVFYLYEKSIFSFEPLYTGIKDVLLRPVFSYCICFRSFGPTFVLQVR